MESKMEIKDFTLKQKWVLWFHKVNDNSWDIDSYMRVMEIVTYKDLLFVLKDLDNITSGMFFIMKEGIKPVYEDPQNVNGGYWSLRISKKEAFDVWKVILYYLSIDNLMKDKSSHKHITGITVSPKINNCIFKIWVDDFKKFRKEDIRNDIPFLKSEELFYLQHSDNQKEKESKA